MKIWRVYGSEHSMKLVMIGRFKGIGDATKANQVIELLKAQVDADIQGGLMKIGERTERYTDDMLNLLSKVKVNSIGPSELEQFAYDVTTKVEDDQLVITTDEIDVSAFLKVLLDKGAHIEVFSAHNYPRTEMDNSK